MESGYASQVKLVFMTIPAGAILTINVSNMNTGVPHNAVYYENADAKEIIFVGLNSRYIDPANLS
jgi:hypothetical protein